MLSFCLIINKIYFTLRQEKKIQQLNFLKLQLEDADFKKLKEKQNGNALVIDQKCTALFPFPCQKKSN